MQRTKIDWVKNSDGTQGYTINPIKGLCKGGCSYCYARNMYNRFKMNPEIRFVPEVFDEVAKLKKPSRIFVCSTHDIMGSWIPDGRIEAIVDKVKRYPQHTFLFLSKYAHRYHKYHFPSNCWLGETCTKHVVRAIPVYDNINYISFEPLYGVAFIPSNYDWIIIGAQTNPYFAPKRIWIEDIISQARDLNIPIYMKSNLKKVWGNKLIQELPDAS